jgi:hypothetical protein
MWAQKNLRTWSKWKASFVVLLAARRVTQYSRRSDYRIIGDHLTYDFNDFFSDSPTAFLILRVTGSRHTRPALRDRPIGDDG